MALSLSDLVTVRHFRPGSVEYENLPIGRGATHPCMLFGLALIDDGSGRAALLVRRGEPHGPTQGGLQVEAMSAREGHATELLASLRAAMRERNVFRGQMIVLPRAPAPGGAGRSRGRVGRRRRPAPRASARPAARTRGDDDPHPPRRRVAGGPGSARPAGLADTAAGRHRHVTQCHKRRVPRPRTWVPPARRRSGRAPTTPGEPGPMRGVPAPSAPGGLPDRPDGGRSAAAGGVAAAAGGRGSGRREAPPARTGRGGAPWPRPPAGRAPAWRPSARRP